MNEDEFKSCFKCGKIGHIASECTDTQVPSEINTFETKIQNQINIIYSEALQNEKYQKDEFGPFLPNPPAEKNINHNWSNTVFCFNCGEPGHSEDECSHPSFESFYNVIKNSLETDNTEDGSKIKQEFESIWDNK
ncbi:hypothetical protein M9Y10_042062 [Tritrichomonas musculus]|uniref:CCHC-type domain-containing protein n=1 Tax=Tritrichomonas musculus TaxID=1915356 RepID=A0ABR2K646_9EUKA